MSMLDKFSLKDRVVVIIGGKGIYGVELTRALAELGAIVYDGARNLEELEEIVKPMQDEGLKVIPAYCDFSKEETLFALRDKVLAEQGRVDGLVVNAVTRGLLKGGWHCTIESFGESMKVNAGGMLLSLRTFGDVMQKQKKGSCVLIGSMMGMVGVDRWNYVYEGSTTDGYGGVDYYFHKAGRHQPRALRRELLRPLRRARQLRQPRRLRKPAQHGGLPRGLFQAHLPGPHGAPGRSARHGGVSSDGRLGIRDRRQHPGRRGVYGKMNVSKFMLGTVQLGINYGMANSTGKPSEEAAFEILDTALESGVTAFDTAVHYGSSEEVVGNWLRARKVKPVVVSKFKLRSEQPLEELEEEIQGTLKRLPVVSGYLYHDADQMRRWHPTVIGRLERMKAKNQMDFIGSSVYTAQDVEDFLQLDGLGAIQIPMSVLDTRIVRAGLLKELKKKGVLVFVRSVFLQGMLCMPEPPEKFAFMKPSIDRMREVAKSEGMTLEQLAVSFIRDLPEVDSLVIGCETPAQVRSNAELIGGKALSDAAVREILEIGKTVPMEHCMDVITGKRKD